VYHSKTGILILLKKQYGTTLASTEQTEAKYVS